MSAFCVYLVASRHRTLYVGVTNDLPKRLHEHRTGLADGFTKKYNVTRLVYFEVASGPIEAIDREKEIKGWTRSRKVALIERRNPKWRDLSAGW